MNKTSIILVSVLTAICLFLMVLSYTYKLKIETVSERTEELNSMNNEQVTMITMLSEEIMVLEDSTKVMDKQLYECRSYLANLLDKK